MGYICQGKVRALFPLPRSFLSILTRVGVWHTTLMIPFLPRLPIISPPHSTSFPIPLSHHVFPQGEDEIKISTILDNIDPPVIDYMDLDIQV